MQTQSVDVEPFANIGWIEATTGSFAEAGGITALAGTHASSDETFSTLGLRLSTTLITQGGVALQPVATLGWVHGFSGLTPLRFLTFEATASSFTVLGVPLDRDEAIIDAGLSLHPVPEATVNFGYQGILSDRVRDNGVQANVAWTF